MNTKLYPQSSESPKSDSPIQQCLNKHDRKVFHVGYAPITLLAFIGTFIYQCVVIPTTGKLIFCAAATVISLIVLKNSGRIVFHALKHEKNSGAPSSKRKNTKKKLVAYYVGFLIHASFNIVNGCYLNTFYLDQDNLACNWSHFDPFPHR